MEDKRVLFSALGLGFGVGLGMGLAATGRSRSFEKCSRDASSPHSRELIELELRKRVVDGKESNVTFDQFPYYLSEQTRVLLTNAGFLYLKKEPFIKHAKGLSPASRAILLSGPAEAYHQMLAKAVAHLFEAKLLLLDITTLNLKLQSRHGGPSDSTSKSLCETALERVTGLLGSFSSLPTRLPPKTSESGLWRQNSNVELQATIPEDCTLKRLKNSGSESDLSRLAATPSQGPLKRSNSLSALALDDKLLVQSLYKVLTSVSRTGPVILYLRDVERLLFRSQKAHHLFHKLITKISGPVLILGSRIVHPCDQQNEGEINERLTLLFPYNIDIKPPDDNVHLVSWTSQLEEDMKEIQFQDNKNHMSEVLAANDIECDDLSSICFGDVLLSDYIEEIVVSAMSHHLMNTPEPKYHDGRLVISSKSLEHALKIFNAEKVSSKSSLQKEGNGKISQDGKKADTKCEAPTPECKPVGVRAEYAGRDPSVEDASKTAREPKEGIPPMAPSKPEVAPDNEFEKRIRPTVIPASEVGVSFADIGALENVKEALQELVMLPLRRPDLFKGGLLKPCRGILLFGPPGTGKTMLAKALATEAGASFINVSMSTITSKWFGEDEKNVKALFTLAAKVSPTVIFIDEVDSMLGQRTRVGEHEAMRKIKNEFMMNWDGLLTKPAERILVLAATNRPFDLDEAIIRRFERRIIVGLPTVENREKILRALLAKENLEVGFDFKELATITEGYTGSDLKNICTTAAYRPIRDLIKKEKLKEKAKMKDDLKVSSAEKEDSLSSEEHHALRNDATEIGITLRPLAMEDMKEAKNQVSASFASEGACMNELKQWNELYGEGGSRKKEQLSYFL